MTTTTSYSKAGRFGGLYRNTLRRNGGYLGLLSALVAVFYPLQYLMEIFKKMEPFQSYTLETQQMIQQDPAYLYELFGLGKNFTGVSAFFFTAILTLAPIVLALLLNSYMQSKKASDVYHAMPVTRGMLLGVNAAAGMSIIAIPVVLSNVVISVAQIAKFGFQAQWLGNLWLNSLGWLITAFAIYTIVTFTCVCVGTVFDSFIFAGVLLFAAPALSGVFLMLGNMFLYGFHVSNDIIHLLFRLSPVTLMPAQFMFSSFSEPSGGINSLLFASYVAAAFYLVLALALLYSAIRIYRRRHSEMAEATTSRGVLQVLIKLIGTAICAACSGMLFYTVEYSSRNGTFLVWAAIGGLLAYSIMEIILNRGFKTLMKSLPLGAAMTVLLLGGFGTMMYSGLGFESRVPSVAKVASVEISYLGRYNQNQNIFSARRTQNGEINHDYHANSTLRDPHNIALVTAFHQQAIQDPFNRERQQDNNGSYFYSNLRLRYRLSNGRVLTRQYSGMAMDTMMTLAPLETSPEFLEQTCPAFFMKGADIASWTFQDAYGARSLKKSLSQADSDALLEAIRTDISNLQTEEVLHPAPGVLARISFLTKAPYEERQLYCDSGFFAVTSKSQESYRFLAQKGLLEPLQVNWEDCYAAVASLIDSSNYSTSAVRLLSSERISYTSDFESLKEAIIRAQAHRAAHPEEAEFGYKSAYDAHEDAQALNFSDLLFEDPADLKALEAQAVSAWAFGEPLVGVSFYFKGAETTSPVLVPLNKLPPELQAQFRNARTQ